MKTADLIYDRARDLPEPMQREVLDFAEYLAQKLRQEDARWSELSLGAAFRGLEEDAWPEYSEEDLREKWQ